MINTQLAKSINISCLVIAIITVLILPIKKKEIWYDESITILCSKGINNSSEPSFAGVTHLSSVTIDQQNTLYNVYWATVLDNGNGFLYNVSLHYFSILFGNSLQASMLLSKLCCIAALLAFYFLSNLLFKDGIFTAVAIILLATGINFMGMGHEIRTYSLATFFIILAGGYFYKFMYEEEKTSYFFLTSLFSVMAILSHYLSVYVILVFLGYLVVTKKKRLFTLKNIIAFAIPTLLLATYFYFSFVGFVLMSYQNKAIVLKTASHSFSALHVIYRSISLGDVNFKAVFPAFGEKKAIVFLSFTLILGLYIAAIKNADKPEKRNLHLLFLLGASGTTFLALLCFKSHHYTALYYRYNSFCIPYAGLFTTYALYVLMKSPRINKVVKAGVFSVVVLPNVVLFVLFLRSTSTTVLYNHVAIAQEIQSEGITKIEVPRWDDAFLVQSLLPKGYKIDYFRNSSSDCFTLFKGSSMERIKVISQHP